MWVFLFVLIVFVAVSVDAGDLHRVDRHCWARLMVRQRRSSGRESDLVKRSTSIVPHPQIISMPGQPFKLGCEHNVRNVDYSSILSRYSFDKNSSRCIGCLPVSPPTIQPWVLACLVVAHESPRPVRDSGRAGALIHGMFMNAVLTLSSNHHDLRKTT